MLRTPPTAYKILQKHYGWWMMLPHDKFQRVIDTGNQTMVLLGSHWIALKQIMAFINETEYSVRQKEPTTADSELNGGGGGGGSGNIDLGIIRWLRYLNNIVDDDHLIYNQWPVWVAEQLERDITFFGRTR
jgi:hypothetical protein